MKRALEALAWGIILAPVALYALIFGQKGDKRDPYGPFCEVCGSRDVLVQLRLRKIAGIGTFNEPDLTHKTVFLCETHKHWGAN